MPEDPKHRDDTSLPIGSRTAHYEILEELGRGGMGVVYRARDSKLDREVAIKTPWPDLCTDPKAVRRFLREGRAASKLSHPNVVLVLDAYEEGGVPFIVMEHISGRSLGDEISARGPLPLGETLRYGEELADALRAAHAASILHRDIKPGNVLLDSDGRAKLTDFGLAHNLPDPKNKGSEISTTSESLTDPGARVGTLPYMSPEQLLGKPLTPASDLFSLGTVLYQMCTGQPAFQPSGEGDVLDAVLNRAPVAISRLNYEVPDELARIVRKLLNKEPGLRYQTATDLLVDLRSLRREIEPGSHPLQAPQTRAGARSRGLWAVIAAGVVTVILGTWWLAPRPGKTGRFSPGTPRRLTTASGWEAEPALSPDGTMVAYSSNQSGNSDLWIVDTSGGEPLRLTDHPGTDRSPTWYPDGRAIAFVSDRSGVGSIWRVPRLGGAAALVVPDAYYPAIAPDGKRIAFSRANASGLLRIVVARLDDPSQALFLTGDEDGFWHHTHPAWSGDGQTIIYADLKDVWIVGSTGGKPRRLTPDPATDREPAWSSDGRHVFFSSNREGTQALWWISASGGPANRLTLGTGPESNPTVSRDGSKIAYSTFAGSTDVVLLDRESGQRRRFATLTPEVAPTIAPDGSTLVFMSERQGRYDLWLQPLEGIDPRGPPRPLTQHAGIANLPTFSPDGRYVAYLRVDDNSRDIWVAPLQGALPRPVVEHPATDTQPDWSPDGSRIAFVSDRSGSFDIWIVPVKSGAPAGPPWRLTDGRSDDFLPVWSPDGKRIAFASDRDGILEAWVTGIGAVAERPRKVTRKVVVAQIRWDGNDALLVSGRWESSALALRRINLADGVATDFEPAVDFGSTDAHGEFQVSRDGERLVFVTEETRGDVWVLDAPSGTY